MTRCDGLRAQPGVDAHCLHLVGEPGIISLPLFLALLMILYGLPCVEVEAVDKPVL